MAEKETANKNPLKIDADTMAGAFYRGCGKIVKFLGDTITEWVKGAIRLTKSIVRGLKNSIIKAGKFIKDSIGYIGSWIGGLIKWIGKTPVGAAVTAGFAILVGGASLFGACVKGAYDTPYGKWIAVAGAGFAALMAAKYTFAALVVAPFVIAPIANFVVRASQTLWYWNWNISDAELKSRQQSLVYNFYSQLGGGLGEIMGNVVCGAIPGAYAIKINPRMLVHIKNELGEEVYQDIKSAAWQIIVAGDQLRKQVMWINAFKSMRRFVKMLNKYQWFRDLMGQKASNAITKWGNPNEKPFVFAEQFENWIESIQEKNKPLGLFLEEFFEEAFESCGEKIILFSETVDSFKYP